MMALAHKQSGLAPAHIEDEKGRRIARADIRKALGLKFLGEITPPYGRGPSVASAGGEQLAC
jgi:hypothetical protein